MRWMLLALMILLLLSACSKGREVSSKGILEDANAPNTNDIIGSEDTETEDTSELDEPKLELPPGVVPGNCIVDSKGVVRVYNEDGTKTVYRHDCVGGVLTRYSCEENKITTKNVICSSGECKQGPYGDSCL